MQQRKKVYIYWCVRLTSKTNKDHYIYLNKIRGSKGHKKGLWGAFIVVFSPNYINFTQDITRGYLFYTTKSHNNQSSIVQYSLQKKKICSQFVFLRSRIIFCHQLSWFLFGWQQPNCSLLWVLFSSSWWPSPVGSFWGGLFVNFFHVLRCNLAEKNGDFFLKE